MGFKKRLLIIIGVPLSICLLLAIALFFIGSDIAKKTEQIVESRVELVFRLQVTETLALLTKDAQQAQNYTAQLNSILPTRDQLVTFPRELGTIARQNKIDVSAVLGKENSSAGKLAQTDFTITGQGTLDNFVNFLRSLGTGNYFINLRSVDMNKQDGNFGILINGSVFSL